jgi:hypothetical protein
MAHSLRIVLAVVAGLVIGSVVNMGLVTLGGQVVPPPAGADVATMEGLKAAMPLFEARHFLFPFLAHALGTLAGALVAGLLVPGRSPLPAYLVGGLFLLGGLASVFMLPAPVWFSLTDLLLAYLPAAWLGQTLAAWLRRGRAGGA